LPPPVITAEHLYFANNKKWRACPVAVHQGILVVADGRHIPTSAITSKEIIAQQYSTKETVLHNLTTTEQVLRVAGWILTFLAPCAFVAFVLLQDLESEFAQSVTALGLILIPVGPLLIFLTRRKRTAQRWGTLYHLVITYPGCDQHVQTASSLMAFYGSNVGLGIVGTRGKLTSGDIVLSSTDHQAVSLLSERIEMDLRQSPRT
jgi:hypothetical protein